MMITEENFRNETQAHYSPQTDSYHFTLFATWPDGKFTTFRDNDMLELRKKIENSGMPLSDDWHLTAPRSAVLFPMWKNREINVDWYTENERDALFRYASIKDTDAINAMMTGIASKLFNTKS